MFDIALLLGPVAFTSLEVPPRINFGGVQRLAVHRLYNGQRVIDALGRDDADISFAGTFSGTDASMRARLVDELRVSGLPLPLTWDVFFYTVLIAKFEANYENPAWIPYRLTCTVLRDEASATINATLSVAADVAADSATAMGLASAAGVDLSDVQTAVMAPGGTVRGTAAYVAAQSMVATSSGALDQTIASTGSALENSVPSVAATAAEGAASLAAAVTTAQQLGVLTAARGYLGRLGNNLANAST